MGKDKLNMNLYGEKPYILEEEVVIHYKYNPNYGDDRECKCGHSYYRHFDSYDGMRAVGCKYCRCSEFIEEDKRLVGLSKLDKENVLVADFVGLNLKWVESNSPMEPIEYELEIDCPDFLDHDKDLMYLYEQDVPYEHFKFNLNWKWLMGAVEKIESLQETNKDNEIINGFIVNIFNNTCKISSISDDNKYSYSKIEHGCTKEMATFNSIVEFIKWYNKKLI